MWLYTWLMTSKPRLESYCEFANSRCVWPLLWDVNIKGQNSKCFKDFGYFVSISSWNLHQKQPRCFLVPLFRNGDWVPSLHGLWYLKKYICINFADQNIYDATSAGHSGLKKKPTPLEGIIISLISVSEYFADYCCRWAVKKKKLQWSKNILTLLNQTY